MVTDLSRMTLTKVTFITSVRDCDATTRGVVG